MSKFFRVFKKSGNNVSDCGASERSAPRKKVAYRRKKPTNEFTPLCAMSFLTESTEESEKTTLSPQPTPRRAGVLTVEQARRFFFIRL